MVCDIYRHFVGTSLAAEFVSHALVASNCILFAFSYFANATASGTGLA
jgi:hypothetical protein